jgi:hypothetical protein
MEVNRIGHAIQDVYCILPPQPWECGFEANSGHGRISEVFYVCLCCLVCLEDLRPADPLSKVSCEMSKDSRIWKNVKPCILLVFMPKKKKKTK